MNWFQNYKAREYARDLQEETQILNTIKEIRYHFGFARKEEKNWVLFKNPSYLESRKKSIQKSKTLLTTLQAQNQIPEMTEMLETLESHLLNYMALSNELASLASLKQVEAFTKKAKELDASVSEQVSDATNFILGRLSQMQIVFNMEIQKELEKLILVLFLAIGFFIASGTWWLRRFRRRWKSLVSASQNLAVGDYSPQLDTSIGDELGILAVSFNEMSAKLASREEKITVFTQELIQANNLLKQGLNPVSRIPKGNL